jgi:hypothetical protein
MKLELKHIESYLSHGLTCNYDNGIHYGTNCLITGADLDGVKLNMPLDWLIFEYVKPLLFPLEILKKDEYFDLYIDLCEEMESISCEYLLEALINKTRYSFNISQLQVLENWMNKNNFDWKYDLIKNGLAIDKSILK